MWVAMMGYAISRAISYGFCSWLLNILLVDFDVARIVLLAGYSVYTLDAAYCMIGFMAKNSSWQLLLGCIVGIIALGYITSVALITSGLIFHLCVFGIILADSGFSTLATYTGYIN